MKRYNPSEIEPKWQNFWQTNATFKAEDFSKKDKHFISCMFPYPSGAGLHAGHAFSFTIVDALARFYRQLGHNVLNPMGYDTFGLPAENYAIKTGTAPSVATQANIANFRKQSTRLGLSIDWDREINTSDPEYYRWTQWIFVKLFERGLAYQKESMQWWCPVDKTVLANEQVESGKCWRCGTSVVKKSMKQWFFKITEYADRLLDAIDDLDWPQHIKTAQRNWIGRSEGAEITFALDARDDSLTVFSTRPDTIFGATFLVIAPEHTLAKGLLTDDFREAGEAYIGESIKKSEIERMVETKEKTGVFTGSYAKNPASGELMPVWIADYVLAGYGTGAVMAVPAHDERDYLFAEKFQLPIVEVVQKPNDEEAGCYHGEGLMVNSGEFNGSVSNEAREKITGWLTEKGVAQEKTSYKMRDWLISRQRYWGAPIPIVHCDSCGAVPVPEDQLPVLLPEVIDYAPKGDGKSILAHQTGWLTTTCPTCKGTATRETDTMDGYACSSWYLLRYSDPHNQSAAWDVEKARYWQPVDTYVGGDHATAHLLYVRFWNQVFYDMGLVPTQEPVKKLIYHGYVNAEDGTKMSKSKGNVVDPVDVIEQGYGADALRAFVLFASPVEQGFAWSAKGVPGTHRFISRFWTLVQEFLASDKSAKMPDTLSMLRSQLVKKVTKDYERASFNTAIAAMMETLNELYRLKTAGFSPEWRTLLGDMARLLAPVAPHVSEEIWAELGQEDDISNAGWPEWSEQDLQRSSTEYMVQVNGKLRGKIAVAVDEKQETIEQQALLEPNVARFLENKTPAKIIFVAGRLVNIVVKA